MNDEKIERLLIRPVEAFEIIGVSRSVGYSLISTGQLPAVRIGRSVRIPLRQLHAWVDRMLKEKEVSENESK